MLFFLFLLVEMVVPEVNEQLLAELEEMGFPKERATRALHYSGNCPQQEILAYIFF